MQCTPIYYRPQVVTFDKAVNFVLQRGPISNFVGESKNISFTILTLLGFSGLAHILLILYYRPKRWTHYLFLKRKRQVRLLSFYESTSVRSRTLSGLLLHHLALFNTQITKLFKLTQIIVQYSTKHHQKITYRLALETR